MRTHPSKRVVWTLVSVVFVVGGTIATSAILEATKARVVADPSNPALPVEIRRDPSLTNLTDTDGDTLLDWEESLRDTDPKNPDTDGDGTSDGAEIAAGRDPKVAGPSDSVEVVASSTDAALSAEYRANRKTGTLTDSFAEKFAQEYASRKFDGGFSSEDQQSLISSLVGGVSGNTSISKTYRTELVPKLSGSNLAEYAAYAESFAQIHVDHFSAMAQIDADLMGEVEYPAAVGEEFREIGRKICVLPAPEAVAESVAAVCNINETIGAGIAALGNSNDPLAALLSVPSLQAAEAARADSYQQIAYYLAGQGVALQAGANSSFWTNLATAN